MCPEVGLFDGWQHLQKVSLNCGSVDVLHEHIRDENGQPFSYVHQLYFGDVIAVLHLTFYEPATIQSHTPQPTVWSYYVLSRELETSMVMAVKEETDYLLFKGVKDSGYPAAPMDEPTLMRKIERESLPAAHRDRLPTVFLLKGNIFVPTKQCHRLGLHFNRNCREVNLVNQLIIHIAKLSSKIVKNFLPYNPHVQLLSGSYCGQLDTLLESTSSADTMAALKSLRASKLQTSASCHSDRRYVHFVISDATASHAGDFYVTMRTRAAISFKSYQIGSFVELDGVWKSPLVGDIVSLQKDQDPHTKTMIVHLTEECGYKNETSDLLKEDVVTRRKDWKEIVKALTGMKNIAVRCFQRAQAYDILSTSEKIFHPTALGEHIVHGLQSQAEILNNDRIHVEPNHGQLYQPLPVLDINLKPAHVKVFSDCLRHTPTDEQLQIFSKFMDSEISFHVIEAAFGSGKSATAAAAAAAYVTVKEGSRVAIVSQTNSAVEAVMESSHLPQEFDVGARSAVRPLVIQSKSWKFKKNGGHHHFDHKVVMAKVLLHELQHCDPRSTMGPDTASLLRSMFLHVRNSDYVDVSGLPAWKCRAFAALTADIYSDEKLYHHFLWLYSPNVFYGTTDMFTAYSSSPYLSLEHFPTVVIVDESTMLQPADLAIFTSKLEKHLSQDSSAKPIRYFLFGDMHQLEPFNTVRCLAPMNVSVNKMLLAMNHVPSRLTTIYRCHPAAVEVLSKLFYNNQLSFGRSAYEAYFQYTLPDPVFGALGHSAYHFVPNNFNSIPVAQSRVNHEEAAAVVRYVENLLRCAIQPSSIVVITPYTAQKELIRQTIARGVRVMTTRKMQGGECDIVVFSSCATCVQSDQEEKVLKDEEGSAADTSRIQLKNGITKKVHLVSDPSVMLVSLSRARHFCTVFGNFRFLNSIPKWNEFFELIKG